MEPGVLVPVMSGSEVPGGPCQRKAAVAEGSGGGGALILFKPEHVEPILTGRKTQARRLGKKKMESRLRPPVQVKLPGRAVCLREGARRPAGAAGRHYGGGRMEGRLFVSEGVPGGIRTDIRVLGHGRRSVVLLEFELGVRLTASISNVHVWANFFDPVRSAVRQKVTKNTRCVFFAICYFTGGIGR